MGRAMAVKVELPAMAVGTMKAVEAMEEAAKAAERLVVRVEAAKAAVRAAVRAEAPVAALAARKEAAERPQSARSLSLSSPTKHQPPPTPDQPTGSTVADS